MSTASQPTDSTEHRTGKYAKFDEYVDFQVSKTGSNIKANDLLTTAVGISTMFLGYLLIFIVFDHWFIRGGFGHLSRLLMLVGVTIACLGWAIWKLVIPYFKKVTRLYSAHALEQSSEDMEGSLLNLIDLKKSERSVNPAIINSLEKRAALRLSKSDTDLAVDRRPLMRLSYCLLGIVILLCIYALFSPKEIWPSISAAMSFAPERDFATQTEITSVTPGNTKVLSGSQLEVIVDLRGEVPEKVMLFYTSSDQGRVNEPVTLRALDDTFKRYQGMIVGVNGRGIRQELTYHIEAGDAVSDQYQVKVIQPPSATVNSVRYDYPQYMGLSAVEQPGGAIDTWEGTKVTIDATTNMPITSFEVLFSDEEKSSSSLEEFKIEKTIQKNNITASWKLKLRADRSFPKFYQIKCRNEAGQTTLSPTVYPIMIRPDLPPEITLLSPKQDLKVPSNGTVAISVAAEDPDFKIRYLNLRVDKEQTRILDRTLFEGSEKSVGLNYDFKLEPLRLTPGDTIYFWVEARDNKQPSGNRNNTPKIKIEILKPVSKEQAQKQLQEQKQQAAQENQNQNPDQKNESKKSDGNKSQPGNEGAKPNPNQANENKADNKESNSGNQKGNQSENNKDQNQSGQTGKQQSNPRDAQKKDDRNPEQNSSKPDKKKGLDSSGEDDQEAIKKILEQLKKEGQEPQTGSEKKQTGSENQDSPKQSSDPNQQNQNSSKPSDNSNQTPSKTSGGSPTDSKNKNGSSKPSPNGNKPADDNSKQKQQSQSDNVPDGKKEPTGPSDDAVKRKSDGNTPGKATPNHDPNAKPEQTNKDVQRDPKDKPATRPGKNKSPDAKPNQNSPSNSNKENSSKQSAPSSDQNPQKGMRKPESSNQNPSPSNERKSSNAEKSKSKDNQPDGSNEKPKGKDQPTEQKSKRPQDGEGGKSSQNDQGQSGSKQPGKGDSTGQKGDQEQGTQEKSSDSKQSMNQNKGQGEKSSGNSKSGTGKQGAQSKGSGTGKGGASQGAGKSKGDKGMGKGSNSENPQGGGNNSITGGGDPSAQNNSSGGSPNLPEAEDANLEYGKEAANLVLKRIKDELKRKEVNQELLKELGWTKEEMKQFSERLQKQLQTPDTDQRSPESLARKRQFEEMLKTLKPASRAARRNRTSTRKQTNDSLGPRRLPVPEEYREAYEAFTRGLAEQKPSGD